jgi:hypothetical protein
MTAINDMFDMTHSKLQQLPILHKHANIDRALLHTVMAHENFIFI